MVDVSKYLIESDQQPLSGKVRLDNAFEVRAVYPGSLADAAGLRAGYFLLVEEGDREKESLETLSSRTITGPVLTRWADLEKRQLIRVLSHGFPFGVELRATAERVSQHFESRTFFFPEVAMRILEGNEAELDLLAAATQRSLWSWRPNDLLFRFMRFMVMLIVNREAFSRFNIEEKIILAAHAAIRGNLHKAKRMLLKKDHDAVLRQRHELVSLHYFTVALIAEFEGNALDDVVAKLSEAYEIARGSARISAKIAELTGKAPKPIAEPIPRPFPGDYFFLEHDPLTIEEATDAAEVSLLRTREMLRADQFVIVIMLGDIRANGFYDPLLEQIARIYPVVGLHFPEIHVVTSYRSSVGRVNAQWLGGERMAIERGVPVRILHDPNFEMLRLVRARYFPHVLIVSKSSMIVYEGSLTLDEGIWRALQTQSLPN